MLYMGGWNIVIVFVYELTAPVVLWSREFKFDWVKRKKYTVSSALAFVSKIITYNVWIVAGSKLFLHAISGYQTLRYSHVKLMKALVTWCGLQPLQKQHNEQMEINKANRLLATAHENRPCTALNQSARKHGNQYTCDERYVNQFSFTTTYKYDIFQSHL